MTNKSEKQDSLDDDALDSVSGGAARVLISQTTYNGYRSDYIACDLAPSEQALAERANYFWRGNNWGYDNDCPDFDPTSAQYFEIPGCRNCQFCRHFQQYTVRG